MSEVLREHLLEEVVEEQVFGIELLPDLKVAFKAFLIAGFRKAADYAIARLIDIRDTAVLHYNRKKGKPESKYVSQYKGSTAIVLPSREKGCLVLLGKVRSRLG
jgi:hypothetical protein